MNFLFDCALLLFLFYLRKIIVLSKEQYEEYFATKWEKYILGNSFENKLKKFRIIHKLTFWTILVVFILHIYIVIHLN